MPEVSCLPIPTPSFKYNPPSTYRSSCLAKNFRIELHRITAHFPHGLIYYFLILLLHTIPGRNRHFLSSFRISSWPFLYGVIVTGNPRVGGSIHDKSQYANNRAELSHQPTRVRERGMRRFKSIVQAQRFLGVHSVVYNLFNLGRHLVSARHYRLFRMRAFASWKSVVI